MHELMIVGAGPAGLAAGVYAARKRLRTVLIAADVGGQINNTWSIENYLGYQFIEGHELIKRFHTQVAQFPIEQHIGSKVAKIDKITGGFEAVTENNEKYQARAVLYAAGKRPRRLNVPGEIEFTGRGVSYCVICDGPVFTGRRVAMVGGGNSAVGSALDLIKIAAHVDLVSLTPLTADPILIEQLKPANNLSIYTEYQAQLIEGSNTAQTLWIKSVKDPSDIQRLDVGGIFIEIGLLPNSDAVSGLLELNEWGEIPINLGCETAVPGFFAAGDVTDVPEKQIIIAAGEGAKAALTAHRYLQRNRPPD